MSVPAVAPIGVGEAISPKTSTLAHAPPRTSFGELLMGGLDTANAKLVAADDLVARYAVDDSIPLHQVTFALEEARMSLEMVMQVRSRLLETYQQFMNMQI